MVVDPCWTPRVSGTTWLVENNGLEMFRLKPVDFHIPRYSMYSLFRYIWVV